ncbi:transglutaminase domain-containing protein [Demequina sp.]|uniref:transglutaminase family protein n=1 Tax=Demequina sp. TaxID=2050685 RepID=UPI0025E56FDF|nr:transglutaminase domain-containing protein [Demequina sp.]
MSRAGWRVLATPLTAIAVGLGLGGLSGLVVFGDWLGLVAAVLVATAAAVVLVRVATGRPFLPTLAGLVVGPWLLMVAYVPGPEGGRTWLPTPAAWERIGDVATEAVRYANATIAPAEVAPALAAAIAAGAVGMFLLVDAVAVGAGFAATSGFLLLVPWLPALTLERRVPTAALAGALAAWLAVVALSRRHEEAGWRRRAAEGASPAPAHAAAAAVAVTVGVALLATPLAIGGPGWGAMPRVTLPDWLGGTARLDLEIDLRDRLTGQSSTTLLTYTSTVGRLDVLRAYSFTSFDGSRWDRDEPGPTEPAAGVLWPVPFDSWAGIDQESVTVRVNDLSESRVPVPATPRLITAGSGWRYEPATDEVLIDRDQGTQGISYTIRHALFFHSEESLRAAQAAIDAGGDAAVSERYRELSPRIDVERVRALAQGVTVSSTDRYEQAVALQEYLRGSGFQYDTSVSPSGDDAVSTFLTDRRGYCVQFATALVVLARALDIPARLAVGFLGGSPDDTGQFAVTGRDAHAWPELYFPEHGWVRFEPTPGQQTGERPEYAPAPPAAIPRFPEEEDPFGPRASGEPAPPVPTTVPSEQADPGDAASPGIPWVLPVVIVALLAGGALAWSRGRARGGGIRDADGAWQLLRRELGTRAGDDSLTPAETERKILDTCPDLAEHARGGLTALRGAVEDHRYAPHGTSVPTERLIGWAREVTTAVRDADRSARAR